MRLAYLASTATLPGSPIRRSDGFEHDRMMAELHTGTTDLATWHDIAWDDPAANWASFDGVMIGTAWDYWDRLGPFLETLDTIERQTCLFNPPAIVRWNIHKSYLRDMEQRGARLIPTLWLDHADDTATRAAFDTLGTDDLVLKRQVGAGADGQHRLKRGAPIPAMPHPMMAQPFLSAILDEGEISFIFIDGDLSHALVKRAAEGDYRIQSTYGGTDHPIQPAPADLAAARAILAAIDTPDGAAPLYARVDMLRAEDGGLLLMEVEMVEPFLYPLEGPGLGLRITEALIRRIKAQRN